MRTWPCQSLHVVPNCCGSVVTAAANNIGRIPQWYASARHQVFVVPPVQRVPDSCMGTLQAVQVVAQWVLDLRRSRHIHVEGRKASLDAEVARLTRRQAHFDREVLVKQRAATALEGGRNLAAVIRNGPKNRKSNFLLK
ncbi:MAG: hypothetical protein M1840_004369 [Geoglossum simile]|nr:MAG: hypothetical protein M1840_004369 [Geoglossum simile]